MTGEARGARRNAPGEGVQVLFMDYLTCLGYNPPKASIRIIASSSSRLRGSRRPFRDLASTERRKEKRRKREKRSLSERGIFATTGTSRPSFTDSNERRVTVRVYRFFFPPIVREARVASHTSARREETSKPSVERSASSLGKREFACLRISS